MTLGSSTIGSIFPSPLDGNSIFMRRARFSQRSKTMYPSKGFLVCGREEQAPPFLKKRAERKGFSPSYEYNWKSKPIRPHLLTDISKMQAQNEKKTR